MVASAHPPYAGPVASGLLKTGPYEHRVVTPYQQHFPLHAGWSHVLETSEPPNCPLVYPARTLRGADTRHPRIRRHRLTQLVLTQIPTDSSIRKDTKEIIRGRKNDPKHPKSIALDSQNDPPNKTIRLPGHRGNTILPVPKPTCQHVTTAKCHLFVNCA